MGKPAHKGVEGRNGKLRIYFSRTGVLERHTLDLADTPANRKHAARLVETIKAKIRSGVYDPSEFFETDELGNTVEQYCYQWLGLQEHLADSTIKGYRSTLFGMLCPAIGHIPVKDVTPSMLGGAMTQHGWKSAKARNNALTPIRGVFELARMDRKIPDNPADMLKSTKVQRPEPDPLTLDEVETVLAWFKEKRDAQTLNYFEFAFFSGLRTSELLALQWGDVDFRKGIVRVQRSMVHGKDKAQTKTYQTRDVDLSARAREALTRQKEHTFLAGMEIFNDPITGRKYVGDKPPRLQWNACLKALGMRHRISYQTRHTFATLALMAGANPMWVSRQMGHATMQMTLVRYSRWIDQADQGKEVAKLDAALSGKNGENSGKELGKT